MRNMLDEDDVFSSVGWKKLSDATTFSEDCVQERFEAVGSVQYICGYLCSVHSKRLEVMP